MGSIWILQRYFEIDRNFKFPIDASSMKFIRCCLSNDEEGIPFVLFYVISIAGQLYNGTMLNVQT